MIKMTEQDCLEMFDELSPETQKEIRRLGDMIRTKLKSKDRAIGDQGGICLVMALHRWCRMQL